MSPLLFYYHSSFLPFGHFYEQSNPFSSLSSGMQQITVVHQAYLQTVHWHYLQTKYFKHHSHMYQQSPFSELSEEQKQLPTPQDQYWTLQPPQPPLIDSLQSPDRPEQVKSQFPVEQHSSKSPKRNKRAVQENKNINRGHWSQEQNKKYHWFLQIHYKHFVNRHMRRTDKIFKTMEIFIGTRQAEQCRSHHQKMEKKYLNFITIISNLRDIHYMTQDTQQLQEQIEANGVEIVDKLATIEQLKAYKQVEDETEPILQKKMSALKSPKQTKPQDRSTLTHRQYIGECLGVGLQQFKQKERQQDMNQINMFEQLRNDIGQLGMYHQKEESGIFQSLFHGQ